jgi:hypothetical protein
MVADCDASEPTPVSRAWSAAARAGSIPGDHAMRSAKAGDDNRPYALARSAKTNARGMGRSRM